MWKLIETWVKCRFGDHTFKSVGFGKKVCCRCGKAIQLYKRKTETGWDLYWREL
jgi:hypothetical protein